VPLRPESIGIGDTNLLLPVFFPSVSSVKTALSPSQYVSLLGSLAALNRQFLVSAFDIGLAPGSDALRTSLDAAREAGVVIMMDSGNYESYWKDAQVRWTQPLFHEILRATACPVALGFDEQEPPQDIAANVQSIVDRWRQDQAVRRTCLVVPIIHGRPSELPVLCRRVVELTGVQMIAVPERRLGDGVFDRAKAVRSIRSALDDLGRYIVLHLLGTGNPISMAIYSASGADSFDGLEWCQTVVDHETAQLSHLSHADFFRAQTSWGDEDMSFHARTLAHNLEFYVNWMSRLRTAAREDGMSRFLRINLPARIVALCSTELGWE